MPEEFDINEWEPAEQAATRLMAQVGTVRKWCREGLIDAVQIGRSWYIRKGAPRPYMRVVGPSMRDAG